MVRCPGQDLRFWKLDDIFDVECPHCGAAVEFWKDEPSVKCPKCRERVVNPRLDLGCAQWCQHAEQCLGALTDVSGILSKRLIREMQSVLGDDRQRIDHALEVFRCAREILASEQGDARVVSAAAILHGLDAPCPGREGAAASQVAGDADLPAARGVLSRCGVDAGLADGICEVIAVHCRGIGDNRMESRILWDAEWLTRLGACPNDVGGAGAKEFVGRTFRTDRGRELAAALFSEPDSRGG